jgi:hypothetical protein
MLLKTDSDFQNRTQNFFFFSRIESKSDPRLHFLKNQKYFKLLFKELELEVLHKILEPPNTNPYPNPPNLINQQGLGHIYNLIDQEIGTSKTYTTKSHGISPTLIYNLLHQGP